MYNVECVIKIVQNRYLESFRDKKIKKIVESEVDEPIEIWIGSNNGFFMDVKMGKPTEKFLRELYKDYIAGSVVSINSFSQDRGIRDLDNTDYYD